MRATDSITIVLADDQSVVRSSLRMRGCERRHNPDLGARMAATPDGPVGPLAERSDRELDVLRSIALGRTNNEIAQQLFLSVRTVETHRAHLQQKLGASTRAELVRYALDHDLIDR